MSVPVPSFEAIAALTRARRTSMLVDRERPVDPALVDELCELATWAPNHKKTWPWRFAYLTGEGRRRLGETMVADMIDAEFGDERKREKTATKYLRTPGTLVIGCGPDDDEMLHAENRDAVAAGIQNILLGATTLGLATFWSTPALTSPPKVLDLCGFGPDDRIVAVIYLGWSAGQPSPADRPRVEVTRIAV
jgi:nitroreductase